MSANPTLSNHQTPQKVIAKIQQKPANYNQYKVVNVNPSPSKPPLIAARPLAPLLPATANHTANHAAHHTPHPPPSTKPLKKPKNDSVQLVQHVRPGHPSANANTAATAFTQDQLNQIAAALQQKNAQNGHSIGTFSNGQFYQFIPIQPNGVKLQQPLIIAPCSPHLLAHSKNSNIQPKPAQSQAPPAPPSQPPQSHQNSDGLGQFLFQTVPNKAAAPSTASATAANAPSSASSQSAAAPVQHQLSATSTNIQMLQQRLAEEEHRQEQLLKQLNEKKHSKARSPDKKTKCDAMDVDEWSHDSDKMADEAGSAANTSASVHSKKRGRPRLYAVDALTGKSIKGKLIENAPLKQKSPKLALQPQLHFPNGFAIYPSPSTSASSSYSQQQNFIINQPAQFNPQFIPLNIVQPMIQEEKSLQAPPAQLSAHQSTQPPTQPLALPDQQQLQQQQQHKEQLDDSKSNGGSGEQEKQTEQSSSEKESGEMSVEKSASGETSVSRTPERQDKKLVDTLKNFKSKVVLTHVIDGFVIKESSEPFPVKAGEPRMCLEQSTPPKSTSTPSNVNKRDDQMNTSRLLDENSLLNTSATSQKSKGKSRSRPSPKKPRKSLSDELDDKGKNPAARTAEAASVCKQEWPGGDPTEWNCDQVHAFVVLVAGEQVAEMFRSQDMDGSALSLIRDDHLVNTMGVKLGPALKIMSKFNEFKIKFSQSL